MLKYIKIVAFTLTTINFLNSATYISLPPSVSQKALYHVKVRQLDDFCCGYNALFNACNLEQQAGIRNSFAQYASFESHVKGFLAARNIHPKAAVFSDTLDDLSAQLGIKVYNFGFDERNEIQVLATVEYPRKRTQVEAERERQKAHKQLTGKIIADCKKELARAQGTIAIKHFICHVEDGKGPHGVLISLVQNQRGTLCLYIFDNLNKQLTERSQLMQYLKFFIQTFSIAHGSQFVGPQLPDVWPTAPEQKVIYVNPSTAKVLAK